MKINQSEEGLHYSIEVFDKTGIVIFAKTARSESYCKSWNQSWCLEMNANVLPVITDVTGAAIAPNAKRRSDVFAAFALAGITTQGIRVGLGNAAVTINDTKLQTPCIEGTAANQFLHQVMVFTAPAVVGGTISFTLKRSMINNSGGAISVAEIGCQTLQPDSNDSPHYIMAFRDVVGPISVPNGGGITVTYTISVTV